MTQKQKILLAFILPAIVALITVAIFLERSHRRLAIERWSVEHKALVRAIAQTMQDHLNEARALLAYTGQLDEFSRLEARAAVDRSLNGIPPESEPGKRHILDTLLAKNNALSTVFLLLPNGDHYLSHPYAAQRTLKKYNLADRRYFQEATQTKRPTISDGLIDAYGNLAVAVDIPLLDKRGEIYGSV